MNKVIFFIMRKFYSLEIASELLLDNLDGLCPNKKLLVIGMAPTGLFQGCLPKLKQRGIIPDVVELNKDHCKWIEQSYGLRVFNQDVNTFKDFDDYDCVYWAEGPEHVSKEVFITVSNKVIKSNFIVECPYGDAPEDNGEVGMKHVSGWLPSEFNDLGFNIRLSNEFYAANGAPLICAFKLRGVKKE